MELINTLIDNYNIPILSAFLLGLLSTISPCTMAANIGAIGYLSKDVNNPYRALINSSLYTLGRGLSYFILGLFIYFGASSFVLTNFFQKWFTWILGPLFIALSLILLNIINFNYSFKFGNFERLKLWLASKGSFGSIWLGMLLALAFCPYAGVIYFGGLAPMIINSSEGLLLPFWFAVGTGLPAILFALVIVFSVKKIGGIFNIMQRVEIWARKIVAFILLFIGIYYLIN